MATRFDPEALWVFFPDTSHVLVRSEATEHLQSTSVIVGIDEELKMLPKLVVAGIVVALDGGILDRAIHPFHLAIGPRMVGLGQSMLDAVFTTDLIEPMVAMMGRPAGLFRGSATNRQAHAYILS